MLLRRSLSARRARLQADERAPARYDLSMWQSYRADIARYTTGGTASQIRAVFQHQGLWALAVYRALHPLVTHERTLIRKPASIVALAATKGIEVLTGISLPAKTTVGPGLFIAHFGPVIINSDARIGAYVSLLHGTTLGNSGRWDNLEDDSPTLGDRVYLGAGACVLGKVTVGDDAVVGANATVTKSLPPRAVAVGSPAQIVSMRGAFRYVAYVGMVDDPARQASLAIMQEGNEPIPDDPAFTPRR